MRALMMTGPSQGADRTEIREMEEPRPGPGEVTIDVAYAGINFLDVMARRGDAGYAGAWPYVPGLEVAGTVREIGRDVTGLAVGQRVAAFTAGGGLAEVVLVRAEFAAPVPDRVPSSAAAAAPLMLTAALLLLEDAAGFRQGKTVLVHSASGGGGEQAPLPSAGLLIGGNLAIGGFSIRRLWATAPRRASAGLRRVLDLITQGQLDIAITEVGSLAAVPAVHELLAEGRGDGKYVARLQG
jgi:NADPH2:quinone reductase